MPILTWTTPTDLERFLEARGNGWIFKHSTRCPISTEAEAAFHDFARLHPDAPVYRVLVIESRPISNRIAEVLGVPHASPQAILVRDGAAAWTASHWEITAGALTQAWGRALV